MHFYPRSPCGERPPLADGAQADATISIHALLAESDYARRSAHTSRTHFYPRSPCGERPLAHFSGIGSSSFLSTLSLRRATWHATFPGGLNAFLSTLSLRRATICIDKIPNQSKIFLSTLSLRRATNPIRVMVTIIEHFYPRSPCGERQLLSVSILIHTKFLSTLSLRRATWPNV